MTWDDLVLADEVKQKLRGSCAHQRYQVTVLRAGGWRFTAQREACRRCSAAKVVQARRLLPSTCARATARPVSHRLVAAGQQVHRRNGKKNLRGVFDAAEEGGAVLLFDEADALCSANGESQRQPRPLCQHRSELSAPADGVVPGHLPAHQSNLRSALDGAFLRAGSASYCRFRFPMQTSGLSCGGERFLRQTQPGTCRLTSCRGSA